jgi:hypothetical protein
MLLTLHPHITEARYTDGYRIEVEFSDGIVKTLDFDEYIRRGGVFAPLADEAFFRSFFIDLNTICWPNGADVAPERLYEKGITVEQGPRSGNGAVRLGASRP